MRVLQVVRGSKLQAAELLIGSFSLEFTIIIRANGTPYSSHLIFTADLCRSTKSGFIASNRLAQQYA
jgi:hypothetical protein